MKDINAEIIEELGDIEGSWLEKMYINNEKHWEIDEILPKRPIPHPNPLHSDPRYREDLIWLRRENEPYAQSWKIRMEVQQRYERKLRQDAEKRRTEAAGGKH